MTQMEKLHKARLYVERIRNPRKREYAETVLLWYRRGEDQKPSAIAPFPENGLTYMAGQAVRLNLENIFFEPF